MNPGGPGPSWAPPGSIPMIKTTWKPETKWGWYIESGLVKRFENPKLCYNIWREEINKILVAKTLRNIYNRKIYIYIYIELKNYKYSKSLLLNILRTNHLPTNTKTKNKKKNNLFFNTRLARIFFWLKLEYSQWWYYKF